MMQAQNMRQPRCLASTALVGGGQRLFVQPKAISVMRRNRMPAIEAKAESTENAGWRMARGASIVGLSLMLAFQTGSLPSKAQLDTETFKAGEAATVEQSDITREAGAETVKKLREVVQDAESKLAGDSGKNDPYVKEIKTVKSEIDALERDINNPSPSEESNIKSLASSIEAQLNGLKAILGFD